MYHIRPPRSSNGGGGSNHSNSSHNSPAMAGSWMPRHRGSRLAAPPSLIRTTSTFSSVSTSSAESEASSVWGPVEPTRPTSKQTPRVQAEPQSHPQQQSGSLLNEQRTEDLAQKEEEEEGQQQQQQSQKPQKREDEEADTSSTAWRPELPLGEVTQEVKNQEAEQARARVEPVSPPRDLARSAVLQNATGTSSPKHQQQQAMPSPPWTPRQYNKSPSSSPLTAAYSISPLNVFQKRLARRRKQEALEAAMQKLQPQAASSTSQPTSRHHQTTQTTVSTTTATTQTLQEPRRKNNSNQATQTFPAVTATVTTQTPSLSSVNMATQTTATPPAPPLSTRRTVAVPQTGSSFTAAAAVARDRRRRRAKQKEEQGRLEQLHAEQARADQEIATLRAQAQQAVDRHKEECANHARMYTTALREQKNYYQKKLLRLERYHGEKREKLEQQYQAEKVQRKATPTIVEETRGSPPTPVQSNATFKQRKSVASVLTAVDELEADLSQRTEGNKVSDKGWLEEGKKESKSWEHHVLDDLPILPPKTLNVSKSSDLDAVIFSDPGEEPESIVHLELQVLATQLCATLRKYCGGGVGDAATILSEEEKSYGVGSRDSSLSVSVAGAALKPPPPAVWREASQTLFHIEQKVLESQNDLTVNLPAPLQRALAAAEAQWRICQRLHNLPVVHSPASLIFALHNLFHRTRQATESVMQTAVESLDIRHQVRELHAAVQKWSQSQSDMPETTFEIVWAMTVLQDQVHMMQKYQTQAPTLNIASLPPLPPLSDKLVPTVLVMSDDEEGDECAMPPAWTAFEREESVS